MKIKHDDLLIMADDFEPAIADAIGEEKRCPNCQADYSAGAEECMNCGIIFAKFAARPVETKHAAAGAAPARETPPPTRKKKAGKQPAILFSLLFIVLSGLGGGYVYTVYIEARLHANRFADSLELFCETEITDPHDQKVEEDEEPFRTGMVFLVWPERENVLLIGDSGPPVTITEPAKIHPAWRLIDRNIRAASPADVDTLIRVRMDVGKTFRYGRLKSKVVATHTIYLDFYDWPDRTCIGHWVFSPGEGGAFMTDEDYESMAEATSDETIAEFIESLPVVK